MQHWKQIRHHPAVKVLFFFSVSFELITKTFRLNLRHPTQSIKCKVAQKWRRRLKTENHAELSSPFHAKTLKRKFEVEYTPLFNQSRKKQKLYSIH